ncbi:MAG TPA: serine hydrolase [Gemmatimonadaceae bacterium]|nr:serine hydrolase [Gemmatimonadaceae bacterium]
MKIRALVLAGLAFVLAAASAFAQAVLITNAVVIDGTGAPARQADVRIVDGRIDWIGSHRSADPADHVIDAHGLTLAPGFIDTHSHHDGGIFDHRDALAVVSQGVTTIVVGQDGGSHFPLASFLARLDSEPAAINIASFAGHGTLRRRVLGDDDTRAASESEVGRMSDLLREEMAAGALGLSTGLEYDPGIFSAPSEVQDLAKVAAAAGGRYVSHVRSEDREFWPAIDELLAIGRVAKMPVQVSHMKLGMRALWGQGDTLVSTLDRARQEGIAVTADVYPWTMWQSTLTVLYPKRNFTDRAETEFVLKQVASPDDLRLGTFSPHPSYAGKTVREIAALRGTDSASTLMALIAESQGADQHESVIATGMDERDVVRLLRWPYANICSDGELDGAHPRGFGSFTRVLGRYVREQHVLTLEEAVRKMTSLAAAAVGISDRGSIRSGMAADLVLFDPRTVAERATIAEPHATSVGIQTVWVNGEIVYDNGKPTGTFPGRALRRPGTPVVPMPLDRRIDEFVRDEMRRQRVPGVAVGVVSKGQVIARGYGYANLEHLVPVTDETIFQSGSLGKMFTAAAVMLLVEDGKLALGDPIAKFFPDAPAAWKGVTVRHLLTHTSGIPDYTTSSFDYRKDYTEDQLAHLAFQQTLEFPPGSRWNYSNTGYALLGFIVHRVSGRFYGDVLAERIFKPVGMTTARVISEADIVHNRAAGYQLVENEIKNQDWVAPQLNTTADGSLLWSIRDLLAWDAAVRRRAILKPESWEQILTPVRLNSGKSFPYGFGWSLDERDHKPLQQHGGSWQGFKTQYSRFLGDDLSIMVLANLAEADPSRFVDSIAAVVNPALAVRPPSPIEDAEPQVAVRLRRLLDAMRAGTLARAEFAYVRAGFFPDAADAYKKELEKLGQPSRIQLLERRELGDDRVYLYQLTFDAATRYVRLGLAPDDRVSAFSLREQP